MDFFKEFLVNVLIVTIPLIALAEFFAIIFFAVSWNPLFLILSVISFVITVALIITFLDN